MASASRPDSGGLFSSNVDTLLGSYDGEYRTVCVWDADDFPIVIDYAHGDDIAVWVPADRPRPFRLQPEPLSCAGRMHPSDWHDSGDPQ